MTFTDLGQLVAGVVQLVEHREMPFCVACGSVWVGERRDGATKQTNGRVGGARTSVDERAAHGGARSIVRWNRV